jgi:hypothetical protein
MAHAFVLPPNYFFVFFHFIGVVLFPSSPLQLQKFNSSTSNVGGSLLPRLSE